MTVWIDDMRIVKNGQYWCHLLADTWEEMHEFSLQQLQLPKRRFHAASRLPHYDITWSERDLAVTLGAVLIGRRELVQKAHVLLAQKSF